MPNVLLLATAWGPRFGGINSFNMDFAAGLAKHLAHGGNVFCGAFQPTKEDVDHARGKRVRLVPIDRPPDSPGYDKSWALDVWQQFKSNYPDRHVDWWVGHDVTTGWAAVEGPSVAGRGQSAVIMHMNYADYQAYKGGVGQRAQAKIQEQRKLFPKANSCFANGPLLRDALKDIVHQNPTMLVPGFADVPVRPSKHRLQLITFGRMDRESDRIKQGSLAVAGFGSAVRHAFTNKGSPDRLKDNPQMRVVGIDRPDSEEERALIALASEKAGREVNLIALPFDEDRAQLFDDLGRANIALMLSWHEGFGLTGWEAVAAEVPLILSRRTGLWQFLRETFGERFVDGYVRTIDVRGSRGGDDGANYLPEDEMAVRDAILELAANPDEARRSATRLKNDLREKLICSWENTAAQFLNATSAAAPIQVNKETSERHTEISPTRIPTRSDYVNIPKLEWPPELQAKGFGMPDSMLLRPESRVVRFHRFREPLRDTLVSWATAPDQPIKIRLQAGEGGAGKTRLLIEVCDQLESHHGWRAGFVSASVSVPSSLPALLQENRPCLLVLDYAETRTREIVEITRTSLHASNAPLVRLVLLAREGGDWWDRLSAAAGTDQVTAAILNGVQTKSGPFRMRSESIAINDRVAFFRDAVEDFAKFKGMPPPHISSLDLSDDRFGNPLFIELLALAHLRGSPSADDDELLAVALGHERSYWRQLLRGEGLAEEDLAPLEQALSMLTLCGGRSSARDSKEILRRAPKLSGSDLTLIPKIFELLRRLYPLDGGLSGLQPDLLGETLVGEALGQDDELLDAVFGEGSSRGDIRHALTVLTRLARRVDHHQKWLRRAFERYFTKISEDALFVGMETGSPLPEIQAEAIRNAERRERKHAIDILREKVPTQTHNLKNLHLEIRTQVVRFIAQRETGGVAKRDIALFEAFSSLSQALRDKGRLAEAADASLEALRHAERVFRSQKENDRQRLASAYDKANVALGSVGKFESALENARKAEEIWRALAENRHAHFTIWASSLINLGASLDHLGRHEEGLQKYQKAEELLRGSEKRLDLQTRAWASCLINLGGAYGVLGDYETAVRKDEQAEELWRWLAEKDPEATLMWAKALGNLAAGLSHQGRHDEALQKAAMSEEIVCGLAESQPDAFTADWAETLANLAEAQRLSGQLERALNTAKQAISLIDEHAQRFPAVYEPWRAFSYRVAAESYFEMSHFEEAASAAEWSTQMWTEVLTDRPGYDPLQGAKSFRVMARTLIALDRSEAVIDTIARAFRLLGKPLRDNARLLRPVLLELLDLGDSVDANAVANVVPEELRSIVRDVP